MSLIPSFNCKINDGYKFIKPYVKPVIDGLLSFIPGGGIIGKIGEMGADKVSQTIDELVKITNLKPNEFKPMLPSDNINKNDIINKNKPIFGRPINERVNNGLNELKRLNKWFYASV